jgi:dTDP-glucose 4,6-dehydratase
VYGDGLNVRDWLYVQDHCSAIEAVLLNGKDFCTYTVGGMNKDISNLDVIKTILGQMGKSEDMIEFVQDRAGHDRRYSVSWEKIHQELGWSPSVSFEEGLQKTIRWYQDHPDWWKPLKQNAQQFFAQNYRTVNEKVDHADPR